MRWRRNFDNCNDCPKQKIGPNATCCGRRRARIEVPNLRDIVACTMRCRSGKVTYLPDALDRIMANAPKSFASQERVVDYVERAIIEEETKAEEFPIEKWFLFGWFDWFEHAHEMV